jgi:hypothetical protein
MLWENLSGKPLRAKKVAVLCMAAEVVAVVAVAQQQTQHTQQTSLSMRVHM